MTIIVWDGTTLAADRMASRNGHASTVDKMWRHKGELIAHSGTYFQGELMRRWYMAGADVDTFPYCRDKNYETDMIVVGKDGLVRLYNDGPMAAPLYDRQFAMGSGRDYAYGAMAMGADAVVAANVACSHETGCGMGVMAMKLIEDPVVDKPKKAKRRGKA
jgi:hypothetical protein